MQESATKFVVAKAGVWVGEVIGFCGERYAINVLWSATGVGAGSVCHMLPSQLDMFDSEVEAMESLAAKSGKGA